MIIKHRRCQVVQKNQKGCWGKRQNNRRNFIAIPSFCERRLQKLYCSNNEICWPGHSRVQKQQDICNLHSRALENTHQANGILQECSDNQIVFLWRNNRYSPSLGHRLIINLPGHSKWNGIHIPNLLRTQQIARLVHEPINQLKIHLFLFQEHLYSSIHQNSKLSIQQTSFLQEIHSQCCTDIWRCWIRNIKHTEIRRIQIGLRSVHPTSH